MDTAIFVGQYIWYTVFIYVLIAEPRGMTRGTLEEASIK